MALHHQGLYVRWIQSPRVRLVIGDDPPSDENSFLIPIEVLQRRSRVFRDQIVPGDEQDFRLPYSTSQTLNQFFVWSYSRTPQLNDSLNFNDVVDLGIFAWKYQIPALSNQVTDRIRANLASGEWELQANVINIIYQATQASSPLREVVKAALGQLSRSSMSGEEWEKTFGNNAEFGLDWFRHGEKDWSRQEYLSKVCRFHNHDGIKRQQGLCDGCPYAEADCYPLSEENDQEGLSAEDEAPGEAVDEPAAEEVPATEEAAVEEPEAATESTAVEEVEPEELKADVEEVEDAEVNGIDDSEDLEDLPEEKNGAQTPHVNGFHKHVTDEAQSESVYPESMSSDREQLVAPKVNGHAADEKTDETVPATPVPLSKNQRKKRERLRKMSMAS